MTRTTARNLLLPFLGLAFLGARRWALELKPEDALTVNMAKQMGDLSLVRALGRDELRAARPGTACPVCGLAGLLALPPQPGQPGASLRDRAASRLRALLPAVRTVAVVALLLAVVAGGFVVGRLTRSTPATTATPPASTLPNFSEDGPVTGRRDFGWRASDNGVTVTLRAVTVGVGFTRLELNVAGQDHLPGINALDGLRVQDAGGNDLLPGGEIAHINTASSDGGSDGSVDTDVVLDQAIDPQALARVQVRGLTIADNVDERFGGVLVDPELQRNLTEDGRFLRQQRPSCPGCKVRIDCGDCRTIRVAGTAYHRDQVLLWLEPDRSTAPPGLNAAVRGVVAFSGPDQGGLELTSWIDDLDGDGGAVVAFDANGLANQTTDPGTGKGMAFDLAVSVDAEVPVRGRWDITQRGSLP